MFDSSPENILRIACLTQERVRLLKRLEEIDGELTSSLPTLLTAIAAVSQKPLKLTDFVVEALRAGYTTTALAGVSGLVYQGIKMLVERGVMKRDQAGRGYVFAGGEPVSTP